MMKTIYFYILIMIFIYHQSNASVLREKISDVDVLSRIDMTNNDLCTTKICNDTAAVISKNMNRSVNPCDDFYEYVCGGYLNSTIIPDDKITTGISDLIHDRIQEQLKNILNETSESPSEPRYFKLAKKLYKICMNNDVDENQSVNTLLNYLEQIGGWPILKKEQWNKTLFNWTNNIIKIDDNKSFWMMSYFKLDLIADPMNNSQHIIYLNSFFPGVSRKYMLNGFDDKHVKDYFNYMINVSVAMGADKKYAQAQLQPVLVLEMMLADITHHLEEAQKNFIIYNPLTVGELIEISPLFPWKKYINYHLNISVSDDQPIIVSSLNYFRHLENVIKLVPKRILANFEIWKFIESKALYMNGKIKNIQKNYEIIQTGTLKSQKQWKKCVKIVSSQMPIATSALYVKKIYNNDVKYNINSLVENVQEQFVKNFKNINWMDNITISKAINKAKKISRSIAYPDELLNDTKINELYVDLELNEDTYLKNIFILNSYNQIQKYKLFKKTVDQNYWIFFGNFVHSGRAAYYSLLNRMIFTAGILQGEFYNNDLPSFMNYARIGMITGHEMTHAFDEVGKEFDENGYFFNWWEKSTDDKYQDKIQCVINQYGNYSVKQVNNMKINGMTTKKENFADIGGIKIAYLAYDDWLINNYNLEKKLPGFFNFTSRQMFWINYGSAMCAKYTSNSLEDSINFDVHSPYEFRVNGPLSNLEEFSKDFECPIDSKMNSKTKCTVW